MAYGNSSLAFIDDLTANDAGEAASSNLAARSWQSLSEACRLALVERSLRGPNELADGLPAAL